MDRQGHVGSEPDPRLEPRDAPEAEQLPDPSYWEDGMRAYEPVHPRSGLGDLLRKIAAAVVALGLLVVKFGGLLLKLKVVTTGASMLVSIAAYAWIWGLPFAIGFGLATAISIGVIGAVGNPMFSFALWFARGIRGSELLFDWLGQVLGALFGAAVLFGLNDLDRFHLRPLWFAPNLSRDFVIRRTYEEAIAHR